MAEANDAEAAFDGEVAHYLLDCAHVHSGCNGHDDGAEGGTYSNDEEEDTHGEVVAAVEEGHHGKARHVHDDDGVGGGHDVGRGCGHNSNLLYHYHGNHPMASCG